METVKIVGLGYVGLANLCWFLKGMVWSGNTIKGYDINSDKIKVIKQGHSPIVDPDIENCLLAHKEDLDKIVSDDLNDIKKSDVLILCLPTDYDEQKKEFNVSAFTKLADKVERTKYLIIRSTIDFNGWWEIKDAFDEIADNILYMPEFLREGSALSDEIYAKKCIITKPNTSTQEEYIKRLFNTKPIRFCTTKEAIMVKLASNTYLATRVAFFNEIDSYCRENDINTKHVIDLMGIDQRIGKTYNRPSFGFGGYCLPKDSRALADIIGAPLLQSLEKSNAERAFRIYNLVKPHLKLKDDVIGFYRLAMKPNSDNIRASAALSVIEWFTDNGYRVIVYEPMLSASPLNHVTLVNDFKEFANKSTFILSDNDYKELHKITRPKLIMGN